MIYKASAVALLFSAPLLTSSQWTAGVQSPIYEVSVTSDSMREPIPASPRTLTIVFASGQYSEAQARAFVEIIYRESRFEVDATNSVTGAYGLGQALPPEKMNAEGDDWRTNPITQLRWVASYIESRYGTPIKALKHHNEHGWY